MKKILSSILVGSIILSSAPVVKQQEAQAAANGSEYYGQQKYELLSGLKYHKLEIEGLKMGMNLMEASKLTNIHPIESRFTGDQFNGNYDGVANRNKTVVGFADFQENVPLEKRVINRIYVSANHEIFKGQLHYADYGSVTGMAPVYTIKNNFNNNNTLAILYPSLTILSIKSMNHYGFYMTDFENDTEAYKFYTFIKDNPHELNAIKKSEWDNNVTVQNRFHPENITLPFKTINKDDPTLEKGKTVVEREGKEGKAVRIREISQATPYPTVASKVETITPAVDKIVRVGTKEPVVITKKQVTEKKVIAYKVIIKKDAKKAKGYKKVINGKKGSVLTVKEETYENGKLVSTEVISKTKIPAKNKVIIIGTKKK